MILVQNNYGFYTLVIFFNNGSMDVLDNILDYYIDTTEDVLHVWGTNNDATTWEDAYSVSSISEMKVSFFNYNERKSEYDV